MARDDDVRSRLTICFEEPFWIGLYERACGGRYEICRIVFGAEPMDAEVYGFMMANAYRLPFSPAVAGELPESRAANPKRMQREVRRQMQAPASGTKAQQALKLQHEQAAEARKIRRRERKEADEARRFVIKQEKKREKRKGH